jgi:hypothetical protein
MATTKKKTSKKQARSSRAQARPNCIDPRGRYAFSANGYLLPDNPHRGPVAWAGYINFEPDGPAGLGKISGNDTVNYADESPVERTFIGRYLVGDNCEVLVHFSFSGDPRDIAASATLYFGNAMKEFRMVQRDPLRVCSGSGVHV